VAELNFDCGCDIGVVFLMVERRIRPFLGASQPASHDEPFHLMAKCMKRLIVRFG